MFSKSKPVLPELPCKQNRQSVPVPYEISIHFQKVNFQILFRGMSDTYYHVIIVALNVIANELLCLCHQHRKWLHSTYAGDLQIW